MQDIKSSRTGTGLWYSMKTIILHSMQHTLCVLCIICTLNYMHHASHCTNISVSNTLQKLVCCRPTDIATYSIPILAVKYTVSEDILLL